MGIIAMFSLQGGALAIYFVSTLVLTLLCLLFCIRFFVRKQITSPIPLYVVSSIYGAIGIVNSFTGFISSIRMRDSYMLMDCMFSMLANLAMLVLLVVMVYTLHRKRKLSAQ